MIDGLPHVGQERLGFGPAPAKLNLYGQNWVLRIHKRYENGAVHTPFSLNWLQACVCDMSRDMSDTVLDRAERLK